MNTQYGEDATVKLKPSAQTPARFRKIHVMGKPKNDANNAFRPSDTPLTEHEKEQIALRKNLKRLRAERLARDAANAPKQKDRRIPKE
jgi:hypothetical protein